ncbi:MAG: hypothetical protein IIZ67_06825 [Bacilli bacterium]|nr:hypothetical protein [Bacilli bacterium]
MGDYSFNNGKFSVVVSNIKSSVYDVVSAISVKLFELGDSGNSKLREQLELELKELIQVSNTVTSKISKIDKMINLEEIDESSLIDVDSSKNDGIDNIKLEPKEVKVGNIERDDEEVTISTKALENLMSDSDNTSEVDVDEEEEKDSSSSGLGDIYNIGGPSADVKPEVSEPEITSVNESTDNEAPEVSPVNEEKPEITLAAESETVSTDKPLEGIVAVEEATPETKELPNIDLSNISGVVEDKSSEVEEKPVLSEKEASIERQRQEANTKKISYIIDKEGKDATRAILVTSAQFDKLLLSHDRQKALCKFRNMFNGEVGNSSMPTMNDAPSSERVLKIPESNENLSLEEMLSKATELYKSGDIKGAEELYNKISEINGSNK